MSRGRVWVVRLAKVVMILVVTWALFRAAGIRLAELDWAEISRLSPSPWLIAVSLVALVLVYLVHALIWRAMIADLTGQRMPFADMVRVYFLASLGRYIPGKVWQIAGLALLAQRAGISPVAATGSAVLGQIGFLSTGLVFAAVMLPAWIRPEVAAMVVAVVVLGAGALLVLRKTPAARSGRDRIVAWLGPRGDAALHLVRGIRASRVVYWLIAYGASWLLLGAAFTLFAAAFVPEAAAGNIRHFAGAVAASYIVGYLAFIAPAGAGFREGSMGFILAQMIPAPAAVAIAVASRLWFTAAELVPVATIPLLPSAKREDKAAPGATPNSLVAL